MTVKIKPKEEEPCRTRNPQPKIRTPSARVDKTARATSLDRLDFLLPSYTVRFGIRDTMILDFRGEITNPKIDWACGPARLDCDHGAAKHRQKNIG